MIPRYTPPEMGNSQPAGGEGGGAAGAQRESLQPDTSAGGSAPGAAQNPGERPENPLLRPAQWSGGFQQLTEVLRSAYKTDADGNNIGGSVPVANSAGFLFDPPVMVEVSRPIVKITKNYGGLWLRKLDDLQDAVNKLPWKGFEPRTVKVVGIEWQAGYENEVVFWSVTYNLAIKWDTWDVRVLDAGYTERIQTGTDSGTGQPIYQYRTILDEHGQPITEPALLDGNGARLQPGQVEAYRVFSAHKQRDLNTELVI